jgi:hypothetical protein
MLPVLADTVFIYLDLPNSLILVSAISAFAVAGLVALWKYLKRIVV